jgi:dipeptidyl aminopeptidase/acylaminoacyl peptidase
VVSDLGQPIPMPMPDGSINGEQSVAESLWSSDGRYLAYIVNRGGHGSLFVYDSQAKASRNLVLGGDEPFGFTWATAGEEVLYLTGGPQPASLSRLQRGRREGYLFGPEFDAYPEGMPIISRAPEARSYKSKDAVVPGDRAWSDLRVIDVLTGRKREATAKERAFVAGSVFSYSQAPHQDPTEVESRDGRFTLQLGEMDPESVGRSLTVARTGGKAVIRRTSAEVCPGRSGKRDVALAYWGTAPNNVVLICSQYTSWVGRGEVVSLNPISGSSRAILAIEDTEANGDIGRQCDVGAGEMICEVEHPSDPPALFGFDLDRHTSVKLYDPNAELRRKEYPRVDRLVWSNSEGLSTQADLVYPPAYRRHNRYPLVITQYSDGGFLRGNTGNENPVFAYAKSGFLVLNYRQTQPGLLPPGLSFIQRAERLFHGSPWRISIQDSLDIVIQDLIDRGLVDPSRVAYTGLSGGANQIDYALANGRRIAAVITSTCCLGPGMWADNPLNPDFYRWIDLENPAIDSNQTKWSAISPELHVKDIHAAILANVAEDERVGFQTLWALMGYAHKPMETYIYAGEHHVKSQPEHLSAIQHRNVDWLRFWLQGYEDPDPARAEQYGRWRQMRDDWCRHDRRCVRPPVRSSSGPGD